MKSSAIIRIVLFSLAIVILGSVLLGILSIGRLAVKLSESEFIKDLDIATFVDEILDDTVEEVHIVTGDGKSAAFGVDELDSLVIEWVAGSILIQRGNTNTITITEDAVSNAKYEMKISKVGKTAEIQFCEDDINFWGITNFTSVSKDLVITVPQNWNMRELEVDAASADLIISDMTVQNASFNMASGEIRMHNCNVDTIDLDTASGDVEFTGTLNVLECDAASANCIVTVFNSPKHINMDSASGNLELILPEDCGFTCDMETLSGHFSSDFPTNSFDGRYIYGNGACQIELDAMSGSIFIHKAETAAP